jgi:hypothetical protein
MGCPRSGPGVSLRVSGGYHLILLILQRQITKNPTPTLTLPLKGGNFMGFFPVHGGDFGFFSVPLKFSRSLPFQGGGQEGDGMLYVAVVLSWPQAFWKAESRFGVRVFCGRRE